MNKLNNRLDKIYSCIHNKIFMTQYPLLNTIQRKTEIKKGAIGIIFMLHRIAKKDYNKLPPNEDLKISPYNLERIIKRYKKSGFIFLSLDDIYDHLLNGIPFSKPFVAFTIDDGYKDNYINAYPIFKKYNVPFCIFISTNFIDKKAILWWFDIEDLIINNNKIIFNDRQLICKTRQQKWDTFRTIREYIINIEQNDMVQALNTSLPDYKIDWYYSIKKYGMSWENVITLSKDPLCTIGSHTKSHLSIMNMSSERITEEIEYANSSIKEHTGICIKHFSFPFGLEPKQNINNIFENLGIRTISYANGGLLNNNSIKKHNDLIYLPRQILK